MIIEIDIPSEIEAGLTALAAAHGLALPQYVRRVLEEKVPGHAVSGPSQAERAAIWRDVQDLPLRPPLSDASVSRDNIYGTRD